MSQKKCPKCGEMNPAEAVMCWACYTPLTGGAAAVGAGGTAAMTAAPTATAEKKEKTAIAPWQIGVVAVAVVLALGFGASQMMGGSTVEDPNVVGPIPKPNSSTRPVGRTPDLTAPVTLPPGVSGGGNPITVGEALQYAVVSPPNPDLQWGVVAIVPNEANITPQRAAGIATVVNQQFGGKSKWKAMQIFVFRTREAGNQFNDFQIAHKYDVLTDNDYAGLTQLWPNCVLQYEVNGNAAAEVRYPSQRPTSWWHGSAQH